MFECIHVANTGNKSQIPTLEREPNFAEPHIDIFESKLAGVSKKFESVINLFHAHMHSLSQ